MADAIHSDRRPRFRVLRLAAWALGTAGLAWAGAQVWRAQPSVQVSAQAAKIPAAPESVEDVALRALRGRLREPASAAFQQVRAYTFGPPDERAVCGRVAAREAPTGMDFVVRVILPGSGRTGGSPMPVLEEGPGLPRATANARHRYCRDADEPRTPLAPPVASAAATSPSGDFRAGDLRAGGNAQAVTALGGGGSAPLKRAVVAGNSAANLRNGPGGGAAVIAVLPRGQILDVFERAAGGWVRVGVGEPWGWTHSSLLVEER